MNSDQIMQIFEDTAYVRLGGRDAEKKAAAYIQQKVAEMGLEAYLEPFDVNLDDIEEAVFEADGVSVPCKGYLDAGCGEVEAPFYYLRSKDPYSLSQCKGKIVLVDGYVGYWMYQDLLENGAVGFVSYDGNVNYADFDIDQRELRTYVHKGNKIRAVNINAKHAVELVSKGVKNARIKLQQKEYMGKSQNVILDMPGEIDEYVVFSAHYDSTSLSQGAYDNMSGSIGLLAIAEYYKTHSHRYGLKFVWCGSEERGLLGSKAFVRDHEKELDKIALNINLDMIGSIMGKFIACCTTEDKLVPYIEYFGMEQGFPVKSYQDVYSSDSTSFADRGVPAVSFARDAPRNTATIHNSYDTMALMSGEQMVEDINFLIAFTDRMVNAVRCPVPHTIPDNIKEKLDKYLFRKRPDNQ